MIIIIFTFILSDFFSKEFKILLEYAAIIVIAIGGFSVLGGRRLSADSVYNRSKPIKSVIHIAKDDKNLMDNSYSFLIFMTLVAIILFIVILVIWN